MAERELNDLRRALGVGAWRRLPRPGAGPGVLAAARRSGLAVRLGGFLVRRRGQGLDLTTTEGTVSEPVVDHEAEYESVLVALESGRDARQVVATAAKLAARRRRGIHVLVTITVPQTSPIDVPLPDQELAAQAVIEQAKVQGGRRVTGHWAKVRPGQAGRLIVQEARELRARAIVLPLPPRRGTTLFGKTLETVLSERPCRVVIESEPAGHAAAREPV